MYILTTFGRLMDAIVDCLWRNHIIADQINIINHRAQSPLYEHLQ